MWGFLLWHEVDFLSQASAQPYLRAGQAAWTLVNKSLCIPLACRVPRRWVLMPCI